MISGRIEKSSNFQGNLLGSFSGGILKLKSKL